MASRRSKKTAQGNPPAMPSRAVLKEEGTVPPMPAGAVVKEEGIPSMPPGAFVKEEVVVKREHEVVADEGGRSEGRRTQEAKECVVSIARARDVAAPRVSW